MVILKVVNIYLPIVRHDLQGLSTTRSSLSWKNDLYIRWLHICHEVLYVWADGLDIRKVYLKNKAYL
jgi:hypothetical protein